jgi:hypothetical protein
MGGEQGIEWEPGLIPHRDVTLRAPLGVPMAGPEVTDVVDRMIGARPRAGTHPDPAAGSPVGKMTSNTMTRQSMGPSGA